MRRSPRLVDVEMVRGRRGTSTLLSWSVRRRCAGRHVSSCALLRLAVVAIGVAVVVSVLLAFFSLSRSWTCSTRTVFSPITWL